MPSNQADFLIVGGGIAGVSVAYELSATSTVILLEAESATDHVAAVGARSAGHGDDLTWRQLEQVERQPRRQPVHRQGGDFGMGLSGRGAHDRTGVEHDLLAI